jgi:hypothetical protein
MKTTIRKRILYVNSKNDGPRVHRLRTREAGMNRRQIWFDNTFCAVLILIFVGL